MTKRNIHIDRLQIRTRGISAETARAIAGDLGHELLHQLSTHNALNQEDNTIHRLRRLGRDQDSPELPRNLRMALQAHQRIARIDAGTTQVTPATKPADLRSQVAKQVAGSIKQTRK